MPTTAATSAPAPQLAPAARVVERDDGHLQIGIRPEAAVRVSDTPSLRGALTAIAHGERDVSNPALLAALGDSGLVAAPHVPGPFPIRVIGSLESNVEAALRRAGLCSRPQGRLALILSVGETDRGQVDSFIRADLPHLVVRAVDGVVILGPFVAPGATACLRCLDAHHSEADPGYPVALERYIAAGSRPREDGCPDAPDPGNAALALAWAARDLRTFCTGGVPSTWSSTIVIGDAGTAISAVAWEPHPRCGCRWFDVAVGG